MIAWGVTHVFGMVGHSNLGFADAMREAEERGDLTFIGIRHEGAASFAATAYGKLTGRLGRLLRHRRTGLDQPADRALRRQGRSGAGPGPLGSGALEGHGPGRVPGRRPRRRVRRRRPLQPDGPGRLRPRRADVAGVQDGHRRTRRRPSHPPRRGAGPARRGPTGLRARGTHRRPGHRSAGRGPRRGRRCDPRRRAAHRPARPGSPPRPSTGDRAGRADRRADGHDVQGQGRRLGSPPAGVRRPGPVGHADRQLVHERVRPDRGVRSVVLESHRHRRLQEDRPGRRRPHGVGPIPPGRRPGAGRRRAHVLAAGRCRWPASRARVLRGRGGRALGDLAGREGAAPSGSFTRRRRCCVRVRCAERSRR